MYSKSGGTALDHLLYQYGTENGGYFVGNPERGDYPHCQLILDLDRVPVVIGPMVVSSTRYGYGMRLTARMQARFEKAFYMEILPQNLLQRGIQLLEREEKIQLRDEELEEKYLIKGSDPDLIRLILSGSSAAALLKKTKAFRILAEPVDKDEKLHTIQVICSKNIEETGILEKPVSKEDVELTATLCREIYEAVCRFVR